ncbi:hypothetical protein SLS62_008269 [Diatrype stigma]|uniref:Zn(2)-C6 fungal-type domain-containing protein n=1 Tax=Diatrype stigma TaxID=117547 RepID=A0AAN9YP66_9PEZI
MLTPPQGYIRKRGPILRVRTGCLTCRARKKKCDEAKPVCAGCKRNKLTCQWPTPQDHVHVRPASRDSGNVSPRQRGSGHKLPSPSIAGSIEATTPFSENLSPGIRRSSHADASLGSASSASLYPPETPFGWAYTIPTSSATTETENTPPTGEKPSTLQAVDDESVEVKKELGTSPSSTTAALYRTQPCAPPQHGSPQHSRPEAIFKNLALAPALDDRSYELLHYYLSRTALSMFNGATENNPFVDQIVPLSLANKFIFQLILSQSASHRAIAENHTSDLAEKDYIKSLRLFQDAIDDYVDGREPSPLWVAMGALIMCFTETAKGDINGVIFNHLKATGPLLTELVVNPKFALRDDLKAFILEYYIYTASMSMISVDPTLYESPFIGPELEYQAQQLANSGYTGPLCGCWLALLLLIPPIFELGRRSMTIGIKPPFPSADDFVNFSLLQSQILAFVPPAPPDSDAALCGYVHQHALHLYLLTCQAGQHHHQHHLQGSASASAAAGLHRSYVNSSVDQAFYYLCQISPTSRVNTSIGWALAVIGCCTDNEAQQGELRRRLEIMFYTLGLGNIRATIELLDHMWTLPLAQRSPWTICKVMQERQIWISFA